MSSCYLKAGLMNNFTSVCVIQTSFDIHCLFYLYIPFNGPFVIIFTHMTWECRSERSSSSLSCSEERIQGRLDLARLSTWQTNSIVVSCSLSCHRESTVFLLAFLTPKLSEYMMPEEEMTWTNNCWKTWGQALQDTLPFDFLFVSFLRSSFENTLGILGDFYVVLYCRQVVLSLLVVYSFLLLLRALRPRLSMCHLWHDCFSW